MKSSDGRREIGREYGPTHAAGFDRFRSDAQIEADLTKSVSRRNQRVRQLFSDANSIRRELVRDSIRSVGAQQIAGCFFEIEVPPGILVAGGVDSGIQGRVKAAGIPATAMRPKANSSCLSNGIGALSRVQAINNLPHGVSSRLDFISRCPFTE